MSKGFGFIKTDDEDLFFHSYSVQGVNFEDLREGQKVSYTEGQDSERPVCGERHAGIVSLVSSATKESSRRSGYSHFCDGDVH